MTLAKLSVGHRGTSCSWVVSAPTSAGEGTSVVRSTVLLSCLASLGLKDSSSPASSLVVRRVFPLVLTLGTAQEGPLSGPPLSEPWVCSCLLPSQHSKWLWFLVGAVLTPLGPEAGHPALLISLSAQLCSPGLQCPLLEMGMVKRHLGPLQGLLLSLPLPQSLEPQSWGSASPQPRVRKSLEVTALWTSRSGLSG